VATGARCCGFGADSYYDLASSTDDTLSDYISSTDYTSLSDYNSFQFECPRSCSTDYNTLSDYKST
jgi:hypothetical protein